MRTIAIIGGGFSGTMAAVNLARLANSPIHIVLINSGRPLGRGAAYGTRRIEHLLNVAARNMSALPDHPAHFVDWLKSRGEYVDVPESTLRETFIPRRIYGDYLHSLAQHYFRPIDRHAPATIEVVQDEAVDILAAGGATPAVVLAGTGTVPADQILLATGNQPPAPLPGPAGPFEHRNYVADPWSPWESRLPAPTEDVVLLGTGLTMVDVFLTLCAQNWQGSITAVSRNGMLPRSHFRGIEYPDYLAEQPGPVSLADAVRHVERHCRQLSEMNQNGAIAVDKLRPHTQRLWQGFTLEEKREFLSRYAARWNVTRHRIAESVHQQLADALSSRRLKVVSGAVTHLSAEDRQVRVHLRDSAGTQSSVSGAFVINCTGPQGSISRTSLPLLQNLLGRGLVQPDDLDLGIAVADDFSTVDASGQPSEWLYAIGPLLKGTLWETIAVPELRGQALRVAQVLLDAAHTPAIHEADVIEYCI